MIEKDRRTRSTRFNERNAFGTSLTAFYIFDLVSTQALLKLYRSMAHVNGARLTTDLQYGLNDASIGSALRDEVLQSRGLLYHILKAV